MRMSKHLVRNSPPFIEYHVSSDNKKEFGYSSLDGQFLQLFARQEEEIIINRLA